MLNDVQIAAIFNREFSFEFNVRLIGGAAEPQYEPATAQYPARLFYREDFAASALHEIAHWCIAGSARRQLPDFGYCYIPPPRTAAEQAAFFSAELKTQALEKCFAATAAVRFVPSVDNLDVPSGDFGERIEQQRILWEKFIASSPKSRATRFTKALQCEVF
ncbi:MAG TPA: diaminobutyrate--2-oxoglutarate aminotransferase [Gammaproteobacteria bacterium]|nr:diaminobutyrate--2-oxoglutarate aminotransferase [Gammaproteobacteria bacterium]